MQNYEHKRSWPCRWAPSLGALERHHSEIWGTHDYEYLRDRNTEAVFAGMYDLRDYMALMIHRGRKHVWWAGSDIRNLRAGFVFNDGKLRLISEISKGNKWVLPILKKAIHWVENEWERDELAALGIDAVIIPSFLGPIEDYEVSFKSGNNVYLSSGAGRQLEYGFGTVEKIARDVPEINFHLYGAEWDTREKNVIVHGRVPKETMNSQIKEMQCGLRLNKTDGFSEVTAKSLLWGQYPITYLYNEKIAQAQTPTELIAELKKIPLIKEPNYKARDHYLKILNMYPWNTNKEYDQ